MTTYNRLFVVPSDETMSYFSSVMSGCPIDLNIEQFKVEIITTEDGLEIDPSRVYESQAVNVNVFYDSYLQRSSLICTLRSQQLQVRAKELNREGVARPAEFPQFFIPHFTIRPDMPPLSRNIRSWKFAIANALCQTERPLYWTGEFVEQQTLLAVPDLDYQLAMAAELQLRHGSGDF
jgi:hypothetical protein